MAEQALRKIRLATVIWGFCGPLLAQQVEKGRAETDAAAPDASRITFGSNFVADPCETCKYNSEPSGYFVWGPDNCTFPGDVQSIAVPFIAAVSGIPDRISTSIILNDPVDCPTNKVTLGLYTDTCGNGPGTLLAEADATVADAPCGLTIAKLIGAPALTAGTKFWVTATTTAAQSALDSRWYASNNAAYAFDLGSGWQASNGTTPAFSVQGSGTILGDAMSASAHPAFGGNLFVDPCTDCNYNPDDSGLDVRGPENCTWPGQTASLAVPFIAQRTGAPKRISAAVILRRPRNCPYNKVTLSLYTDNNCQGTPGTLLVSAEAIVPEAPCDLAIAKLRNSPLLSKGVRYWVTATTTTAQAGLDAGWSVSNNAQFASDLGIGWIEFSAPTPAFLVE